MECRYLETGYLWIQVWRAIRTDRLTLSDNLEKRQHIREKFRDEK